MDTDIPQKSNKKQTKRHHSNVAASQQTEFFCNVFQQDINRQITITDMLDKKLSILGAINIGALAFISSNQFTHLNHIYALIISAVLVVALACCGWTLWPRKLMLYLPKDDLKKIEFPENPPNPEKILNHLINYDLKNKESIRKKLRASKWASISSFIGSSLFVLAYLFDHIMKWLENIK